MTLRICCAGELMWDFHAQSAAPLMSAERWLREPGGAAANVALELGRLGIEAAVTGVVSRDEFGRGLVAALEALGVDASAVAQRRGRSGVVFVDHPRGEEDNFLSYRPSLPFPKRLGLPKPIDALHIAAINPDRRELASITDLATRALGRGALVMVDVNARPRAWRGRRCTPGALRSLMAAATVVKASASDLACLGLDASRQQLTVVAERLGLRGDALLVVTRGAGTAHLVGHWGVQGCRPPSVEARWTVGAGDVFSAALLAAIAGAAIEDSKRFWRDAVKRAQAHVAARLSASR